MLIRRAWVGEPPAQLTDEQVDTYRSYAPAAAAANWGADELATAPDPGAVAARLVERARSGRCRRAQPAGARARGRRPPTLRAQIERLGAEAVPVVRDALYRGATSD